MLPEKVIIASKQKQLLFQIKNLTSFYGKGKYCLGIMKIILEQHCVKSVRIRSFSGLFFLAFGLNTDQKNSEYGHC